MMQWGDWGNASSLNGEDDQQPQPQPAQMPAYQPLPIEPQAAQLGGNGYAPPPMSEQQVVNTGAELQLPGSGGDRQMWQGQQYQAQQNAFNNVASQAGAGGLGHISEGINNIPLIPGVGLPNAISGALGGPQIPSLNIGDLMGAASLPGQGVERIPGFSSQPEFLQGVERNAANLAPLVAAGPGGWASKAATIGLGAVGQQADTSLGLPQLPLVGGPLGLAGLVLPGGAEHLLRGAEVVPQFRPAAPDVSDVQFRDNPIQQAQQGAPPPGQPGPNYSFTDAAAGERSAGQPPRQTAKEYMAEVRQLEKDRAAAGPAQREIITPAEDQYVGRNDAGEALYERNGGPDAGGDRYRMRTDSPTRGEYSDFGGDLAVTEQAAAPLAQGQFTSPQYQQGTPEFEQWRQGVVDRALNPGWQGSPPTMGPDDTYLNAAYKEGFHGIGQGELVKTLPQLTQGEAVQGISPPPTLYHGTGSRFEAFDDTGASANQTALFGPGVYLTDSRPIAEGYAKNGEGRVARGNASTERMLSGMADRTQADQWRSELIKPPEGTVHSVQIRPDLNLLDLEHPVPPEVTAHLRQLAETADSWDADAWDLAAKAAQVGEPGKGIYSAFKDGLQDGGLTKIEAGESLQALSDELRGLGYDGLTHTGGIHGGPAHNVTILFDPKEAQIVGSEGLARPAPQWDTSTQFPDYAQEARNTASNASFDQLAARNREVRNLSDQAGTGPGMAEFSQQRASGIPAGEVAAPVDNNGAGATPPGGRPPSGGPPSLPTGTSGGIDWNPLHNLMSAIGAPTQPLLTGLHLARFAPQEALRPAVLGNGLRAMGEAFLKGRAPEVMDHVNNGIGPNIPNGFRASDMKAATGIPHTDPTAVQWMINHTPVVGPVLERFQQVNSALLGTMRDAHYNFAADRLARTDPGANANMYRDLWREANNATGHSTIPGLRGSSVSGGMGIGWGALTARVQELGNTVLGSGAPVPGLAVGSRAEAFKTLMGVAGTMAATTALGKALGADVNTTDPFTQFGLDSTFLRPVTSNGLAKTVYGTGGAGYDTLFRGAANIGNDLFAGDEAKALQHALAFARGEFGVVPSGVIDAILGQKWNGDPYTWRDFLNEAKTGFMADEHGNWGEGRSVPIAAGENYEAVKAYGPEGLLRALPADLASSAQTTPINTTAGAFKYSAPPDILAQAFPDSPIAQKALAGKDWNELLGTEKHDIIAALQKSNPEVVRQIQEREAEKYPATAQHSQAIDALQSRKTQAEDRILDLYNAGQLDKAHTRNAMFTVQKDYYTSKDKVDADPAYVKELAAFKSNGTDPSAASKALDAYYQIGQHFEDKATRQQEQAKYIQWLQTRDPELASRIVGAIQPRNQTQLEKVYAAGGLN